MGLVRWEVGVVVDRYPTKMGLSKVKENEFMDS